MHGAALGCRRSTSHDAEPYTTSPYTSFLALLRPFGCHCASRALAAAPWTGAGCTIRGQGRRLLLLLVSPLPLPLPWRASDPCSRHSGARPSCAMPPPCCRSSVGWVRGVAHEIERRACCVTPRLGYFGCWPGLEHAVCRPPRPSHAAPTKGRATATPGRMIAWGWTCHWPLPLAPASACIIRSQRLRAAQHLFHTALTPTPPPHITLLSRVSHFIDSWLLTRAYRTPTAHTTLVNCRALKSHPFLSSTTTKLYSSTRLVPPFPPAAPPPLPPSLLDCRCSRLRAICVCLRLYSGFSPTPNMGQL